MVSGRLILEWHFVVQFNFLCSFIDSCRKAKEVYSYLNTFLDVKVKLENIIRHKKR